MTKFVLSLILFWSFMLTCAQEQIKIINTSSIAFTISEKDLLPENIAYNPLDESFFIGSTRKGKIIKYFKDGSQKNFITSKQDGLYMVIGMKVDIENNWLWVCSSGGDNLIGYNLKDETEGRPAGIFKFNLDTGKLIKKYVFDIPGEVHFFNDLTIDKYGNIYVTHMFQKPGIYTIQKKTDKLELFLNPSNLKYPNGIAISGDNKFLFIAHSAGIVRIDIASKQWINLNTPENIDISGKYSLDGLYYYKNSLLGIQQSINTVQQFYLNYEKTHIIKSSLLEVNHPMMDNPTTGVLHDDEFYYIANSQFDSFNKDGTLFSMEKLYDVCVLKINLDTKY